MVCNNEQPQDHKLNQTWFDERAALHAMSDFYNVQSVIDGEVRLSPHEIAEVGDVVGKDVIQLQCHIGLEAISWARMGARTTGLDFSGNSLEKARSIAEASGVSITYLQADVYDAAEVAGVEVYDVVYTNGGSLHWLPDLDRWGHVVERLIRPGGQLYLNLFHPVSLVLSEDSPTFERDYFDTGMVEWDEPGSYVDTEAETINNKHQVWDRPVSEIVMAVIRAGLIIKEFHERPGQEFQQFVYQTQGPDGKWYNPTGMGVHPSTFSLKAIKPNRSDETV
jgi:SAM-dependent methyltransferase